MVWGSKHLTSFKWVRIQCFVKMLSSCITIAIGTVSLGVHSKISKGNLVCIPETPNSIFIVCILGYKAISGWFLFSAGFVNGRQPQTVPIFFLPSVFDWTDELGMQLTR